MKFPLKRHLAPNLACLLRIAAAALITIGARQLWRRSNAHPPLFDRKISNIDVYGVSLEEGIRQLGAAAGIKIAFDPASLPAKKIELSGDLHLHDVELGVALDRLNAAWFPRRAVELRGSELYMTPIDRVPPVVHVYDVTDIIERWMAMPHSREVSEDNLTGNRFSAGPPRPFTRDQLVMEIVRTIQHSIHSMNWAAPGSRYAIIGIGTRIVVTCPQSVHRSIEAFFRSFRTAAPGRPGT